LQNQLNAKSKFIPVSPEALEDCHYKGSKDLLCLYLNNNENSELFTGKSLRLGGSSDQIDNNSFDLSAILMNLFELNLAAHRAIEYR
jgi:hypothetical protein